MDGSKNHLRSFVATLGSLGIVYEPQALDPDVFAAIIGR